MARDQDNYVWPQIMSVLSIAKCKKRVQVGGATRGCVERTRKKFPM